MKANPCITSLVCALSLAVTLSGCNVAVPGLTVTTQQATPPVTTTQATTQQTTAPPETQATQTQATTEPELQTTVPTIPSQATEETLPCDAPLYSIEALAAMDNTLVPYGSGYASGGRRPGAAVKLQAENEAYGACFIGEDSKDIYLTFDCGYEYNNLTPKILDVLQEKQVKAVFFVTLSYCKKNPENVWRIINEGHTLGNHSVNHLSMPGCSIDQMTSEVMQLHDYVKETFGGYEMTLFRPPMGEYSVQSLCAVQNLGYRSVFWSFAYRDWLTDAQPEPWEALQKIVGCAHGGGIYLLHAVSETNAAVLANAIDSLRAQGYTLSLFA